MLQKPFDVPPINPQVPQGFNGHPPLGVNATNWQSDGLWITQIPRFNGHPPLGVNATHLPLFRRVRTRVRRFNGHPPLGVNATLFRSADIRTELFE